MSTRFPRGSTAYTKDGRTYTVEDAADGIVYCTASNGAETEFPDSMLMTEAEWAAGTKGRPKREVSYARLSQARHFLPGSETLDAAGAEKMLSRADRFSPGLIDFAAVTVATRILAEHKDDDLAGQLSIRKCRAIFDAAPAAVRARLLAELLGAKADALVSAAALGDNLLNAMVTKGLEMHAAAYDEFQDRPRN
ncbi:MAG: hypothetical protein JNM81_15450 [Rhodospirillaceae bacterium]|nr:hypothetical protein [Rhodospirillaceae bacterium]